jgi:hypothetical protein
MRLTIVIPDDAVYKDGVSYSHLSWQGTPPNVHALQWFNDNTGWIEFNNGDPQLDITALPEWADNALAAWNTANTPTPPAPPTPKEIEQANSDAAQLLLNESDFTQLPDVNLANKEEWATYRAQVREIAINPPIEPAVFPKMPALIWA